MYISNLFVARLIHLSITAVSLMLTAYFLKGFRVGSFVSALIAALVIGFMNAIIRPILLILTLPLNIVTLGLFTFVVNGIVLKLCAAFVPGFDIEGIGTAILGSIILTIVSAVLNYLLFA